MLQRAASSISSTTATARPNRTLARQQSAPAASNQHVQQSRSPPLASSQQSNARQSGRSGRELHGFTRSEIDDRAHAKASAKRASLGLRLTSWQQSVATLLKELRTNMNATKAHSESQIKFADALTNEVFPREKFDLAKKALEHFSQAVQDIEKHRVEHLCTTPEESVFKCLEDSAASVKPVQKLLRDAKKADEALQKILNSNSNTTKLATPEGVFGHGKRRSSLGITGNKKDKQYLAKVGETMKDLTAAQTRMQNADDLLEDIVVKFERRRVLDLKNMLAYQVRAEMAYHCHALERLTPLAKEIMDIDCDHATTRLQNDLLRHQKPQTFVL